MKTAFKKNSDITRGQRMESFFGKDLGGKGGMICKDQAHQFQIGIQYQSRLLHEFRRCEPECTTTHATKIKDFAAQADEPWFAVITCGYPDKINNCVTVIGHSGNMVCQQIKADKLYDRKSQLALRLPASIWHPAAKSKAFGFWQRHWMRIATTLHQQLHRKTSQS